MVEKNIIIAEFMGLKIIKADDFNKLGESAYTGDNKDVKWGIVEYLEYPQSWNLLMPVVEKVWSLGYGTSLAGGKGGFAFIIHISPELSSFSGSHNTSNTPLEATYKALVEFIEWYNSNKL